jgi:TonB family protein
MKLLRYTILSLLVPTILFVGCGTIETKDKARYSSYIELAEAHKDVSFDCPSLNSKPRTTHSGIPTNLPRFRRHARLEYPMDQPSTKNDVLVRLEFYFNDHGVIEDICVLESGGQEFDIAAMDAVLKSSLYPAEADGKPIPVIIRIPVEFRYGD